MKFFDAATGSLGQGISQAAGIAMARKRKNEKGRVFIFMSDGEFQIGQTWEAIQARRRLAIDWEDGPGVTESTSRQSERCVELAGLPPLIKGYIRSGGMICGEPAWDPDFNSADLLMLLPMAQLNRSYARRFGV